MTRGNHTEPRYDRTQGRPLMPCAQIKLDHVLPQKHRQPAYPIINAAHIPFERQHNLITSILFYMNVSQCEFFAFLIIQIGIIILGWFLGVTLRVTYPYFAVRNIFFTPH